MVVSRAKTDRCVYGTLVKHLWKPLCLNSIEIRSSQLKLISCTCYLRICELTEIDCLVRTLLWYLPASTDLINTNVANTRILRKDW